MAESAYERGYRHASTGQDYTQDSGGSNVGGGRLGVFSRKLGPLPLWAWMAIMTVVAVGWYVFQQKKSSSSSASSTPSGTPSNLIPQFVNQTYTNVTPPAEPSPSNPSQPSSPPVNGGNPPHVPNPPPVKSPGTGKKPVRVSPPDEPIFNSTYKVKKGDTLEKVAAQFQITREQLAHANGLGTGAGLRTGQVLHVPSPAPGGTPNKAQ